MTITIITSAAYIDEELVAEFGRLPPAFLPVGHNRLYDLQAQVLGRGAYLTLPMSYKVPDIDFIRLEHLGIKLLYLPDDLSLGESVLYALEVIGQPESSTVRIMHGDTMIYDLPVGVESFAAAGRRPDTYKWGTVLDSLVEGSENYALAGYFQFTNVTALRRELAKARGDFVSAINNYKSAEGLNYQIVDNWLDFGHIQTYYMSRCSIRTQRAFNDLDMSFRVVKKRSNNFIKLEGEALWYENIPPALKLYTPAFLGKSNKHDKDLSYSIEYLPLPSLHELFVFGDLNKSTWERILESCFQFLKDCNHEASSQRESLPLVIESLTSDKTVGRLEEFEKSFGLLSDLEWRYNGRHLPSLKRISEITACHIDAGSRAWLGVMHGDLCFTNIFYDYRTQRIRVIDPRGNVNGSTPTVMGDGRYDMAKLNHSIAGGYDLILAGRYACDGFEERNLSLQFPQESSITMLEGLREQFELKSLRLSDTQITAITIHLFISMLPLHSDRPDRQKAFVANALRLFEKEFV